MTAQEMFPAVLSDALTTFLRNQLDDAVDVRVTGLRRSGTGSSRENWPFTARWVRGDDEVEERLLLRRDPTASVVDTARATEFGVLRALAGASVPAPKPRWLDDTGEWFGSPSMIVEQCEGQAHRAVLRDVDPMALGEDGRAALAVQLCDLLAEVHLLDVDALGLPSALSKAAPDAATAELENWDANLADVALEPQPELAFVSRWLHDNRPTSQRTVLVHGDFRPANVLVSSGSIEVLLDWELAHLGDHHDDLGWYCAPLYATEHFIPGVWEQHDFLARYADKTGFAVDAKALAFWQVLAVYRLCVMALAGVRNFCEGRSDRPAAPATALLRRHIAEAYGSLVADGRR